MARASSASRGQRLSVDARRAQLIELGKEMFANRPYDAISTDEIAERAQISRGLLYHYFPNKRAFYVETIKAVALELNARIQPDPSQDFETALRASLHRFTEFVEENPRLYYALVRGGIGSDEETGIIIQGIRAVSLHQTLSQAGIDNPSPELRTKITGWIGMVEAACLDWIDRGDLTRDALVDLLTTALLNIAKELQE